MLLCIVKYFVCCVLQENLHVRCLVPASSVALVTLYMLRWPSSLSADHCVVLGRYSLVCGDECSLTSEPDFGFIVLHLTCVFEAETKNHLNLKFILRFTTWCQTKSLTVTCQRLVPDRQLISHVLVLLVFRLTYVLTYYFQMFYVLVVACNWMWHSFMCTVLCLSL